MIVINNPLNYRNINLNFKVSKYYFQIYTVEKDAWKLIP